MDEFDQLLRLDQQNIEDGRIEAEKHFIATKLPPKADNDGFVLGSELQYYRTMLELLEPKISANPNVKKIIKSIESLNNILSHIESSLSFDKIEEARNKFSKILMLLNIKFSKNDSDAF